MTRGSQLDAVVDTIASALDAEVCAVGRVSGGDVAEAFRVELGDRRVVFAKTRAGAPADFFDTEARGLRWLRQAEALPVPEVLFVGTAPPMLVLAWIDETARRPTTDVDFGRALAALHLSGAPCFGREDRRRTGSRGLPNEPVATWSEFFAEQRLLPLARLASDEGALPAATVTMLETVAHRLSEFGAADEAPARLHGDLWACNRIIDAAGKSWLIDPAAHGGHREFDLAMMQLFGGWADDVFGAYHEVAPLETDWRDRVGLHQLAPLAVHAIKFGGSYVRATTETARRYC